MHRFALPTDFTKLPTATHERARQHKKAPRPFCSFCTASVQTIVALREGVLDYSAKKHGRIWDKISLQTQYSFIITNKKTKSIDSGIAII